MSISGLRKAGETYAKRYARLTMLSVAVAAVLTAVVGTASTPGRIAVLSNWLALPATVAVFIQWFGLCFVVGLMIRILSQNFSKLQAVFAAWIGDPIGEHWSRLARRTQAVLFGSVCTLLAGTVAAAGVFYYGYPYVAIAAAMSCTWPLATYWLLGRRPTSVPTQSTIRTRYATLRHLETRIMSVLFGFLCTVVVAGGLWLLGVELRWIGLVGLVVWVVSTVIVYNRYAATLERRSALTILDSTVRENGQVELVVRNDGEDTLDLSRAMITDTRIDRYHLTDSLQLSPAGSATLCVPESFTVAPTDAKRTLPLGYTLNRSQPTPVVYTRSGIAYELTHGATASEALSVDPTPTYSTSSTAIATGTHSHES